MCIAQLLDSITLVTYTKSPAARDVVVYVDEDRTEKHALCGRLESSSSGTHRLGTKVGFDSLQGLHTSLV